MRTRSSRAVRSRAIRMPLRSYGRNKTNDRDFPHAPRQRRPKNGSHFFASPWFKSGLASRCMLVFALATLASCGPGEGANVDPGVLGRGGECGKQEDCFECQGCRSRYGEVCVEGLCWLSGELDPDDPDGYPLVASYNAYVGLPKEQDASAINSAAIRVIHPLQTDGSAVTCGRLLSDPLAADEDDTLNPLRVLQPALVLNTRDDVAVVGVGHVPVGGERLFLVRLHAERHGQGALLGVGCTEGVEIEQGEDMRVEVETARPD